MWYWNWIRNIAGRPFTTGYPTEQDPLVAEMACAQGEEVRVLIPPTPSDRPLLTSMAIRQLDAGSCNGCESELSLLPSPYYDFSRYGYTFIASPKHADLLVVTGIITEPMIRVILEAYDQLPEPKRVVAVGSCAVDGSPLQRIRGLTHRLHDLVPVAVEVVGCPPSPGTLLRGLRAAVERVAESGADTPVKVGEAR
ncbi:MAG: NADH:ubiquinone oxidoreductase [Firmicutes bacterium]|nr:NADH:ubiquinone oxidoreductase [Bacillota bacterium]